MVFVRSDHALSVRISSKRLPRQLLDAARFGLDRLLGFQGFNDIYRKLPPCEPAEFSRVLLDAIEMRWEFDGEPLVTIPAAGPLIVIANHPFGIAEGLALDAMLQSVRPDVTIMVHHVFSAVPEWAARYIFVAPAGRRGRRHLSLRGWRQAFHWLSGNGAMLVFPAGRVAQFDWRRRQVVDQPWSPHIAALAMRTGASVLPVFVHGHNGPGFHLACKLCPPMQDLLIFGELGNKRGQTFRATVGRVVHAFELSEFRTPEEVTEFLRRRTESLAEQKGAQTSLENPNRLPFSGSSTDRHQ